MDSDICCVTGMSKIEDTDGTFGVLCGKCKGESLYFKTCPQHHYVLSSYCKNCGEFYKIKDGCPECEVK